MTSHEAFDENALLPADASPVSRNLTRSPHPYFRRSTSLIRGGENPKLAVTIPQDDSSESSTERGTEADDERGPILRGLPAPPIRARKGWKGSKSPLDVTPALSPFPTPPPSEHGQTYFSSRAERKQSKTHRSSEVQQRFDTEKYRKYVARRKAEIVRRCTETGLVATIGLVTCKNSLRSEKLQYWIYEISIAALTIMLVYSSYPFQLMVRKYRSGSSMVAAVKSGFHIPSRFDPGPLLYPVFFPFFIAVSLMEWDDMRVLVNIVLGLASIPSGAMSEIPTALSTLFQWMLCLLPLAKVDSQSHVLHHATIKDSLWNPVLSRETLALLFPLHQILLSIIGYLTTTSLDPVEAQLLSTALINLLLFSASPQISILRAILWLGVISMFVLCHTALSWEVSLARIPAWKFSRNKSPKSGLLGRLEATLDLMLPSSPHRQRLQLDSDDEDYDHLRRARRRAREHGKLNAARAATMSSDIEPSVMNGKHVPGDTDDLQLSRSATFPDPRALRRFSRQSSVSSRAGFLALTFNQAQALKWVLAAYVYAAAALILMLILRPYIGYHALGSHEPFGWAFGYLLGNIPQFRLWVVSNNLERWIALPQHRSLSADAVPFGWIERYRQVVQGPANTRLLLIGYCLAVLGLGLAAVVRLKSVVEVDTRRKIFHGIMVAMLLPIIPIDPGFISLALIIILGLFLLLDLFRASQLPPLSRPLTAFLAPYVDGRDYRGPVIISHIFLLIGCAIPLWLAQAGTQRAGRDPWVGWEMETRDLSMVSGVVCVGMGDAAASLIGRRYGRSKWFWGGGKSIEGSAAFALAVTTGLMASYLWLRIGGWVAWEVQALPQAVLCAVLAASGASLLESVLTAANDNVVVPVGLWLLVRGFAL